MNTEATAVLRVPAEIHRRLKSLAAEEGRPLADLATEAVEREIARRQDAALVRLAVAPPWPPSQTR
jgi:predicted DNA-binding protein